MSLLENIKAHEGFRDHIYKDSLGKATIGYGFLVAALSPDELKLNGGKVEPMGKEVAEKILNLKVSKLKKRLFQCLPWLQSKPQGVQDTLIEMAYQLGLAGLMGFRHTLSCIEAGDYAQAAKNLKASLLYRQTPKRVEGYIKGLKNG
ncbi:MAG: glycoside hydrolase family protein [Campylobacter gracilis]|uniref:glycoside hydrolase family protein n=1 Tax=Campylobacter gracilis TaxID=824 RepID=UPI0026EB547B|nr:glycoside hydrolase family protein [Campylobacter gracilis]MBS6151859.1 glycoside hydrolase family protein [Campylobacter gracilis]